MLGALKDKILKSIINMLEYITPNITFPKAYNQITCMFRYVACHINQVVDNCPVPAPFHRPFQSGISPAKGFLAYHTQYVIRQDGQFQNQFICLKFSGWQTLKVHVCFQLAVELFAFPMGMVMPDDIPVTKTGVCPPHIDFNVWNKEELPVFINRALSDLISHADCGMFFCAVFCLVCDLLPVAPDIDIFAIPGMGNISPELSFAILSQPSLLSLRRLRLMMNWQPCSRSIPIFSEESLPESSRKSRGSSVSWRQIPMVSLRNSGVPFWQCCFPSRSSRLAR